MKKNKIGILALGLFAVVGMMTSCGGGNTDNGDDKVEEVKFTELTETTIGTKDKVDANKLADYSETNPLKIALVTDSGTLDDHSFNESSWKGVNEFAVKNGGGKVDATTKTVNTGKIQTKYYQPTKEGDDITNTTRLNAMKAAVSWGAKVIVLPGYLFQTSIKNAIKDKDATFKDVKILALDCVNQDNETYKEFAFNDNVTSVIYREEQAGFLAGYGAVKEGMTKLGFIGGMAVPAVVRYGSGYVQGAAKAAEELKLENPVEMQYYYAGQFAPTAEAQNYANTWYKKGTQAIFACGGAVYQSVTTAAAQNTGAKWIGVDVNQHADTTLGTATLDALMTSAMKNLTMSVEVMLTSYVDNGFAWKDTYKAKVITVGAQSSMCKLPTPEEDGDATCWGFKKFTLDEYKKVNEGLKNGSIKVNSNSDNEELTSKNFGLSKKVIKVNYIA